MAGHCQFEPAAKHRAEQSGDDRARRGFQAGEAGVERRGAEGGVLEGGDVAARHESTAGAFDDEAGERGVGLEGGEGGENVGGGLGRQRVDGGIVDAQDADAVLFEKLSAHHRPTAMRESGGVQLSMPPRELAPRCFLNSMRASWSRCTSSGPSARRKRRAVA